MSLSPSARPAIRVRVLPRLPVDLLPSGLITIQKVGLTYTFGWSMTGLAENVSGTDLGNRYLVVQNVTTNVLEKLSLANFPINATLQAALDAKLDDSQAGAFGLTLLGTINQSAAQAALALVPGVNVQTYDADLAAIASLSSAADKLPYATGAGTWALADFTNYGRSLVAAVDAAAARTTLGAQAADGDLDALAALSGTNTIYYRSGANTWSPVTISGALTFGAGILSAPAVPNGTIINVVPAAYTTNADLTATIPLDDTIPQSTEGTQVLSASITPSATTSRIRAEVKLVGALNAAGQIGAALFDGSANALQSSLATPSAANNIQVVAFDFEHVPGVTTPRTYTVRVGPSASGTLRLNGTPAGRLYGGSMAATLTLEEIKA